MLKENNYQIRIKHSEMYPLEMKMQKRHFPRNTEKTYCQRPALQETLRGSSSG